MESETEEREEIDFPFIRGNVGYALLEQLDESLRFASKEIAIYFEKVQGLMMILVCFVPGQYFTKVARIFYQFSCKNVPSCTIIVGQRLVKLGISSFLLFFSRDKKIREGRITQKAKLILTTLVVVYLSLPRRDKVEIFVGKKKSKVNIEKYIVCNYFRKSHEAM